MADAGFRSVVAPLHADHVASIRPVLLWMQAGAFALLLIGAVNLANLLLIRASGRAKEIAVRQALGANWMHVVSEAIVETTLLTLTGGLLGLAAGAGGIRLLSAFGTDRLPLGSHISFDARLAGVAVLGAVVLGLVLAVPIAWFNLRGHLSNAIQSETRGGMPSRACISLRVGWGTEYTRNSLLARSLNEEGRCLNSIARYQRQAWAARLFMSGPFMFATRSPVEERKFDRFLRRRAGYLRTDCIEIPQCAEIHPVVCRIL